ncbi:chloride channel protein [Marinivivus vitaminiproducens]|uniref:chloride channel protein n=1 Tax=Marinivivus vitaminiproducens TaxID=3035935 RepID=UPI0027A94D61|nr:chloride channel protein [Geminicoccaceae bacterium SCSIO 64248]
MNPPPTSSSSRLRKLWQGSRVWKRRLVFWLGALGVGLISVVFAYAADLSQEAFFHAVGLAWWLPLVLTPLGFLVCAHLARTVCPGSQGSGIPQAIAGRALRSTPERNLLLSPRIVVGKIGLTLLGLLTGASVGREGPTVQVGAAVMLQVAAWGGLRHARGLILAGSAAGIAAAFNTPLGGIVFAIEEMSRSFEQRTNGLVLYAVIISGLVSLACVGNYTYFGELQVGLSGMRDWATVVACGLLGGLAGGAFSRGLLDGSRFLRGWMASGRHRALILAGGCGLLVAVLGLATGNSTFGTGYEQARAAIDGEELSAWFWPAKLAATLATALSGIPGGIFAPSLSVGAGLGDWLGDMIGSTAGLAAVFGMAGYFAGVVQAPLTAFVLIIEMTGSGAQVIPIMVTSVLGYGVSKLVAPEPLYHGLAESFIADGRKRHAQRRAGTQKREP